MINIYKSVAAVLTVLSLSGCVWQTADQSDISKAIKACGSVQNILYMDIVFLGVEQVLCTDGVLHNLSNVTLP